MGDEKHFLDMTLDDLRTADQFVDKPDPDPDGTPAEKVSATPDAQVILENVTGVGANDETIDIPDRPEFDALVKMTGGPEKLKENAQALREAVALSGRTYDELIEGLTPEEENAEIASTLTELREAYSSPAKAAALLNHLWSNPHKEPMKSYIHGRSSDDFNEAIAKLFQAAHGEPVIGRKKARGDGHSY